MIMYFLGRNIVKNNLCNIGKEINTKSVKMNKYSRNLLYIYIYIYQISYTMAVCMSKDAKQFHDVFTFTFLKSFPSGFNGTNKQI